MPIARTVSGLIYFDEFDSEEGWPHSGPGTHGLDGADKKSGAYSQWNQLTTPGGAYISKVINVGSGSGRKLRIWHKISIVNGDGYAIRLWNNTEGTPHEVATHDWQLEIATLINSGETVAEANIIGEVTGTTLGHIDKLTIAQSDNLTVTGLTPGQKVEIYRSVNDALVEDATCQSGQSSVTIDISSSDYLEQLYMKVYATDGSTLIETTASYDMCGGDTWAWSPGAGTMKITVDYDIIYRTAAVGTPKTSHITANLKTPAGANYPGALIYFTTTRGAVNPTSDTTDANGNAETDLTSSEYGIAVIKANWLGDATVPACSAYYTVHVFYEADAPDSEKAYQFCVQGIEYSFIAGHYTLNEVGAPNEFEVEIPEWFDSITPHGLVNIYRKGVKEFHGVLKGYKRSLASDRVVLRGPDVAKLLDDRVVDIKVYEDETAQYMIDDLLDSFPCGIYPGSLGSCPDELTITIDTENLHKAIDRICGLVGWYYRVNKDRTLDFAESFTGGTSSAIFTEGENIIDGDRDVNLLDIMNFIRMKGDGITSVKQDGTEIQENGLHQAPAFNKSISDQSTLDTACQALLDLRKAETETTPLRARDTYEPGTFGPEDYVTVTAPSIGLSGLHQVRKITRHMNDAEYVEIDLDSRSKAWWEVDEVYRRMTKDANI